MVGVRWGSGGLLLRSAVTLRARNPILADRLASIFLTRVIQTNAVARGNKGCRQIPCQLVFFVIYRARFCHTIRLLRWVLCTVAVEAHNLPIARQPGPVRSQERCRGRSDMAGKSSPHPPDERPTSQQQ